MENLAVAGVDITSEASRASLSKMLMGLFDHWGLDSEKRLMLLGLSPANRASLSNYKKGAPLPNSTDLLDRAGHLLSIHKSLRILFPHDRHIVYGWVTAANKAFNGKTPLDVMIERKFVGVLMVRAYLDTARGR